VTRRWRWLRYGGSCGFRSGPHRLRACRNRLSGVCSWSVPFGTPVTLTATPDAAVPIRGLRVCVLWHDLFVRRYAPWKWGSLQETAAAATPAQRRHRRTRKRDLDAAGIRARNLLRHVRRRHGDSAHRDTGSRPGLRALELACSGRRDCIVALGATRRLARASGRSRRIAAAALRSPRCFVNDRHRPGWDMTRRVAAPSPATVPEILRQHLLRALEREEASPVARIPLRHLNAGFTAFSDQMARSGR